MQSPKKYTNHLINETSPYLLQHAHNPVDWYPWGDEAFERAKAEDMPVLVSIGYSACHWCHVMEHESFEDEAAAQLMNENFVSIKVDMEERPDVDQIYMTFVQMTTGRGGWPMNVFLPPDKLPFFGGTYFPPVSRYNMPSWPQILTSIAEAWREKRDELLHSANEIVSEIRRVGKAEFAPTAVSEDVLENAFASFVRSFDAKNGGVGVAPKFPPAMSLEFLLRYWKRTGNENALEIVKHTAAKMANGGIYDQLGGGFHRYATDAIWLVPHFEKMLYDNAQLIRVYLHLYQIARSGGNASMNERASVADEEGTLPNGRVSASIESADAEFYKRIAVETLEYVKREMLDRSGGFYSSQDADSEGVEGKFFVWTAQEIVEVLSEDDGPIFNDYYDVTEEGNFEGANILNVKNPVATAPGTGKGGTGRNASVNERASVNGVESTLPYGHVSARKRLFEEREKRVKPFRDEKVLTAWNGLMLAAFAEAAAVLGSEDYLEIAKRNADFLLGNLVEEESTTPSAEAAATPPQTGAEPKRTTPSAEAAATPPQIGGEPKRTTPSAQKSGGHPSFVRRGALLRTWKDGRAKLNGYIEDHANLADGLIELYQASGEMRYLLEAKRLADAMITEFWDEENGGVFFTSNDHEELIVRNKDFYDNATPAGNSVAADVLLKLSKFFGEEKYERFAATVLRLVAPQISRYPQGVGRALSAIEFFLAPVKEVVIIGEKGNDLEREIFGEFLPNKVVVLSAEPERHAEFLPLLQDREMIDGKATAYVCENFVCQRPVVTPAELRELLS